MQWKPSSSLLFHSRNRPPSKPQSSPKCFPHFPYCDHWKRSSSTAGSTRRRAGSRSRRQVLQQQDTTLQNWDFWMISGMGVEEEDGGSCSNNGERDNWNRRQGFQRDTTKFFWFMWMISGVDFEEDEGESCSNGEINCLVDCYLLAFVVCLVDLVQSYINEELKVDCLVDEVWLTEA